MVPNSLLLSARAKKGKQLRRPDYNCARGTNKNEVRHRVLEEAMPGERQSIGLSHNRVIAVVGEMNRQAGISTKGKGGHDEIRIVIALRRVPFKVAVEPK